MALVTEKTSRRSHLRCREVMFVVGPPKMKKAFSTGGELVVSTFVASILFLVLVAMRDAVVVFLEHLVLLEGVVDRAHVVRTRLLKHVVEQATTASRGASRSFTVKSDSESLLGVLCLPRSALVWWDRLLSLPPPLLFLGGGVELNVAAFPEGTTCRSLVHELVRSRPANTNELFDSATNYAAGEEAVGAIFDDKPNKRKDDAPAEGSNVKPNAPKKQKRGRKGKKPVPPNQRGSGQAEDSEEAFAAAPDRKGRRGPLEVWWPVRRHA